MNDGVLKISEILSNIVMLHISGHLKVIREDQIWTVREEWLVKVLICVEQELPGATGR